MEDVKRRRFLCRIGIHKWEYTPAVYRSEQEQRLAIPDKAATRKCTCCPAKQVEDIHCLGLNPPEYVSNWYNQQA